MGGSSASIETNYVKLQSGADNTKCLVHAADGIKMQSCNDTPDEYWKVKSFAAIAKAASDSNNAGATGTAGGATGSASTAATVDKSTTTPPATGAPTASNTTTAVAPSTTGTAPATGTTAPAVSKFSGSIGYNNIGLKVNAMDVMLVVVLLFLFVKLLKR